jgi:hypothetical protein
MAADADTEIRTRKEELLEEELDKFMDGFNFGKRSDNQDNNLWF